MPDKDRKQRLREQQEAMQQQDEQQQEPTEGQDLAPRPPTAPSMRFVRLVEREFEDQLSTDLTWSDYERRLAQHMFARVDLALNDAENKRLEKNPDHTPITWANVNLQRLALDAADRVALGIDALLPNHLHPVARWNKRLGKYEVALQLGYKGRDHVARTLAPDDVVNITYQLVHEADTFRPIMRSGDRLESYEFEITKPFDRGKVVGGFGYVEYEDPRKNTLVLVTPRDFAKARQAAQSGVFWHNWELEMQLKTVVHRTCKEVQVDPRKVAATASFARVQGDDLEELDERVREDLEAGADGEVLDIEPSEGRQQPGPAPEEGGAEPDPEPAKTGANEANGPTNPERTPSDGQAQTKLPDEAGF